MKYFDEFRMVANDDERYDPGHVRRIDFLRFLDDQDVELDIYGSPENGFRHWRSPTPPRDKGVALLPYRYYFDAENNSAPNFYTEKIVDCLLAETLCFYWGCPNLDSFFDPRAFIRLELEDFEADLGAGAGGDRGRRVEQAVALHPRGEAASTRGVPVLSDTRPA